MESVASGERVRGIEIEDGENAVASKDREGGRGKEREGVIFAREGCAVRRAAAQNLGRAHFPPLSGSLSRPLFSLFFYFFCARPPSRGARAAFHPRGPRRFFFSSVCAATPPRHNGRVPENSSLGRHPFPRPPRLFRQNSPRASTPAFSRTLIFLLPSPRASSFLRSFFLSLFFCPGHPSVSTLPPTSIWHRLSPSFVRLPLSSTSPQGCILRDPPDPRPASSSLPYPRLRRDTLGAICDT